MMLDQSLVFLSPNGPPLSLVGAAGAIVVFPNVIDELGQGVGTPPANIIGNTTLFGSDMGIGIWVPEIQVNIGVATATANAATPAFVIEGAADTGAGGNYQPGTWYEFVSSGAQAVTSLPALAVVRFKFPPSPPEMPTPRYYRMIMKNVTATNLSAGTCTGAFIVQGRDDLQNRNAASNYVVR